ncbi:MAG: Uma2 family endonuclease, partial [Nostocaceae cyanobacterium]|nr:Uma2 family endonuclease [Nostocaceae cyanobacterium]
MSESDFQRESLMYAVDALNIYFQDRPDVYVSGTLSIYYEEGNTEPVATPDVFVVMGVEKRQRSSYILSQEGKVPDFVLEIISKTSLVKDLGVNRGTYSFLGVSEYFLYDPTGEAMNPTLRGLTLVGENYQQIPLETLDDGVLSLKSQVLGLEVRV